MLRGGCVYLRRSEPEVGQASGWIGHWEKPVPDTDDDPTILPWTDALARGLVEEGNWATVEDAIAWGRERADHVLVYLAHDIDSIYSAGEVNSDSVPYLDESGNELSGEHQWPTWPPPPEIWPSENT